MENMIADGLEPEASGSNAYAKVLKFEAPYLIDKLLKECIVRTRAEGEALFLEARRYLILNHVFPNMRFEMMSRRIDEVWHQFVLFTVEYADFCHKHFGKFLHHFPSNAPDVPGRTAEPTALSPFEELDRHYGQLFGSALPEIWFDVKALKPEQRVIVDECSRQLRLELSSESVSLYNDNHVIFSVSKLAASALDFVTRTQSFCVRELPGDLTDEEKVGLAEALMAQGVLITAP